MTRISSKQYFVIRNDYAWISKAQPQSNIKLSALQWALQDPPLINRGSIHIV